VPTVRERVDTGRTEAFSDGVFAIAVTLLVLEISVPEDAFDNLWRGIADQWPSYLAYFTSFSTVGGLWLAHHAILRRMRYADSTVIRLNLLLLMAVAFLPFPTSLVAEAINRTSAERPAVLFYGASLLVTTALITAIGRYAGARTELLREGVPAGDVLAVASVTAPSLGFYAVVLLLAALAPVVAAFGFLGVGLLAVLRARGDTAGEPGG